MKPPSDPVLPIIESHPGSGLVPRVVGVVLTSGIWLAWFYSILPIHPQYMSAPDRFSLPEFGVGLLVFIGLHGGLLTFSKLARQRAT